MLINLNMQVHANGIIMWANIRWDTGNGEISSLEIRGDLDVLHNVTVKLAHAISLHILRFRILLLQN